MANLDLVDDACGSDRCAEVAIKCASAESSHPVRIAVKLAVPWTMHQLSVLSEPPVSVSATRRSSLPRAARRVGTEPRPATRMV